MLIHEFMCQDDTNTVHCWVPDVTLASSNCRELNLDVFVLVTEIHSFIVKRQACFPRIQYLTSRIISSNIVKVVLDPMKGELEHDFHLSEETVLE